MANQIPLFQGGNLGRAPKSPGPALDNHQAVRISTAKQAAASQEGLMPVDGFVREAAAGINLGEAINQAGVFLQRVAEQKAKDLAYTQITDFQLRANEVLAKHESWRATKDGSNPSTWEADWSTRIEKLQASVGKKDGLGPLARTEINNYFKRFRGRTGILVARDAAKLIHAKSNEAYGARLELAVLNQDMATVDAIVDNRVASGNLTPEGADLTKRRASDAIDDSRSKDVVTDAKNNISLDPWLGEDGIDALDATDSVKSSLRHYARSEQARRQLYFEDDLMKEATSGEFRTEDSIRRAAQGFGMSGEDTNKLLVRYRSQFAPPPPNWTSYGALEDEIASRPQGPIPSKDRIAYHARIYDAMSGSRDPTVVYARSLLLDQLSAKNELPDAMPAGIQSAWTKELNDMLAKSDKEGVFGDYNPWGYQSDITKEGIRRRISRRKFAVRAAIATVISSAKEGQDISILHKAYDRAVTESEHETPPTHVLEYQRGVLEKLKRDVDRTLDPTNMLIPQSIPEPSGSNGTFPEN